MEIHNNVYMYPMPVVVVGTMVKGDENYMTVGWVNRVNALPPMVALAIGKRHRTVEGIMDTKAFSVNIPSANMVEKVDFVGIYSGREKVKSLVFDSFTGELGTPMINECPVCMECRLKDVIELPTNYLVIGEIVKAYSEESYMTNGKLDIKRIDPLMLTMPDNSYWRIGKYAGDAWNVGKGLVDRWPEPEGGCDSCDGSCGI